MAPVSCPPPCHCVTCVHGACGSQTNSAVVYDFSYTETSFLSILTNKLSAGTASPIKINQSVNQSIIYKLFLFLAIVFNVPSK